MLDHLIRGSNTWYRLRIFLSTRICHGQHFKKETHHRRDSISKSRVWEHRVVCFFTLPWYIFHAMSHSLRRCLISDCANCPSVLFHTTLLEPSTRRSMSFEARGRFEYPLASAAFDFHKRHWLNSQQNMSAWLGSVSPGSYQPAN